MGNVIGCSIILKDDFNNVLIIKKGSKKSLEPWKCVGRLKKGKESNEKCITNSIKEDLNTLVFDLEPLKEFVVNSETNDSIMIYEGKIKEYMNLGKKVVDMNWISEREIDKYDFIDGEKEVLLEYFKLNK
ncbi:hypothetical protein K5V21_09215 [Clostridium sardiniense]|uniref:Nudix hydrolase domain-containing protein n=1 Tax=Clostridium sardiniense TaxID=29369 RepID=A0ABS7KXU6_CLOSR|nr:hypothetical protein [Clostridium sardiniense]MBM7836653.1 hypothetical protein [Clostridium sardiniense]MBY0755639.1 hypothetical protein [Clostridium sardiniense]MDQ0461809.1 hypothetical protein [Clostridium sardiniense]